MLRRSLLFLVVCLVMGIVLGGAPVANGGGITQSLLVGVKQDPRGGFTNADLKGRYWFRRLGLQNFETSDREAEIIYGYIDFNGAGLWTGSFEGIDSDGNTGSKPFNGTYSVNTNGSFIFNLAINSGTNTGYISKDVNRNFTILSDGFIDDHGIHQGIVAGVREPDTTLRLDSINGTWRSNDLELENFEGIDRVARTCRGTLECNNGNWSLDSVGLESNGDKEIWTGSGTYSLNSNSFDFFEAGNPEVLFSAYTSGDGNILIFTAGFSGLGQIHQIMGVALKQTTKIFTNADLSGAYNCHMMTLYDFETDDRKAEIIRGSIIFDGSGHWTFTGQVFYSDGSLESGATGFGTYSVNPDGSFTFIDTSDTPGTGFGNISADNNTIIGNGDEAVHAAVPITGDWDGDGRDEIGLYYPSESRFYLDTDNDGILDQNVSMGRAGDLPVIGDWDGNGIDDIGVFRPSGRRFYLDTDRDGIHDISVTIGRASDVPVVGDWDQDGRDDIGVFRPSVRRYYMDFDEDGIHDRAVTIGRIGDYSLVGDWDGDGADSIGVYRPGNHRFYLDDDDDGIHDHAATLGTEGDIPVTGDWDGDGQTDVGVFRPSDNTFYLDSNLDGTADETVRMTMP